jgi:hypothetical protein
VIVKSLPALALTALLGSTSFAAAEGDQSANYYLPICKSVLAYLDTGDRRRLDQRGPGCTEILHTMIYFDSLLRFCAPKGVSPEQAIRVVVKHLDANPGKTHQNFRSLTLEAFRLAWPC